MFLLLSLLTLRVSAQEFVPGKIWVKFKPELNLKMPSIEGQGELDKLNRFPQIAQITEKYGLYKLHQSFVWQDPLLKDIYTFWIQDNEHAEEFVREMAALESVEYAERAPMYRVSYTPNDWPTSVNFRWHLMRIQATDAWDLSKGDTNIVIAIVDDGVRIAHEDLIDNIYHNWAEIPGNGIDDDGNGYKDDFTGWDIANNDPDPSPATAQIDCASAAFTGCHGTGVAHCASGTADNAKGIPAIGFKCKLMPIKCQDEFGSGGIIGGYEGVTYAAMMGAHVINMSWGNTQFTTTGLNVITAAHNKGCVLISSAGNDNVDIPHYPSDYKWVLNVAATRTNSTISQDFAATFTNYSDSVDISAPGTQIRTARANSLTGYHNLDGTSFASPIVSGLCGLMLSANPCLTTDEIEFYLESTADFFSDMNTTKYLGKLGAGRINAKAALEAVIPTTAPAAVFNTTVNPCDMSVQYTYGQPESKVCFATYTWSFPGGTPATSNLLNPTVSYPAAGTYDATLTISNQFGTNTTTQNVAVTFAPSPTADAGADIVSCFGKQYQLNASSNTLGVSYAWTPNQNITGGTTATPTITVVTSRDYILTVTDPITGCTGSDTVSIILDPTLGPTIDAGADIVGCYGEQIQVTPNVTGSPLTYAWTPNSGISSTTSANPTFTLTSSNTYFVTVTDGNGCKDVDTMKITVNPSPSIYAGQDQTITLGGTVQLNGICGTCVAWSWSPATGLSNPNINNPIASPTVTTTYVLEGTNASGCKKTDEVKVTVNGVGIDNTQAQGFSIDAVYPNPAQAQFTLQADLRNQGNLTIEMLDMSGKKIMEVFNGAVTDGNFTHTVLRNELAAGVYLLVWNLNGEKLVQKVSLE